MKLSISSTALRIQTKKINYSHSLKSISSLFLPLFYLLNLIHNNSSLPRIDPMINYCPYLSMKWYLSISLQFELNLQFLLALGNITFSRQFCGFLQYTHQGVNYHSNSNKTFLFSTLYFDDFSLLFLPKLWL